MEPRAQILTAGGEYRRYMNIDNNLHLTSSLTVIVSSRRRPNSHARVIRCLVSEIQPSKDPSHQTNNRSSRSPQAVSSVRSEYTACTIRLPTRRLPTYTPCPPEGGQSSSQARTQLNHIHMHAATVHLSHSRHTIYYIRHYPMPNHDPEGSSRCLPTLALPTLT